LSGKSSGLEMSLFGSAKVNVVTSGTEIRDEDTGRMLGKVTDEETVFRSDAVFVTAATWNLIKAALEGAEVKTALVQSGEAGLLH
jgi:hypothetical protein